ncbi:MAG: hypothetical protein ACREXU_15480, partial [Gammaproteobacteria bacterium]
MDIRPIKSEGDYKRALRAIEQLWEAKPDGCSSDTDASMHRSFGEQHDVFGDLDGPLVGGG